MEILEKVIEIVATTCEVDMEDVNDIVKAVEEKQ